MKSSIIKRQLLDYTVLIAAYFFAAQLSHKNFTEGYILIPIILAFIWHFSSKYMDLYDEFRTTTFINELLVIIPIVILQFVTVGFLYFVLNDRDFSRTFAIYYVSILSALLVIEKYLYKKWKIYNWTIGKDIKNLLIVGSGANGMAFYDLAKKSAHYGYNPIGFVDKEKAEHLNGKFIGKIADIERIIKERNIHEIIISLTNYDPATIKNILSIADHNAIRAKVIPEYLQFYSKKFKMDIFGHLPVIVVRDEPLEEFHWLLMKNFADFALTIILSVCLFSWLFPLIAILIKLDSKGPVFYIQDRWGIGGKTFKCFKFRTMAHNSNTTTESGKFFQTTKNDLRITRVGKFLRKTNLDEIPQFINILLGDMSFIGPRPHAVQHSIESNEQIENYLVRHLVKPGITGWAQVNGYRGETKDIFLMKKRVEYDIWYIENWSVWLDLKVLTMTLYMMIKGDKLAY